jgi:methyl-accepting chemotaxis protein
MLSGVPLLSLVVVGGVGILKSTNVGNWINLIGKRNVPQLIFVYEIQGRVTSTLRHANGVFMTWDVPEKRSHFLSEARGSLNKIKDDFSAFEKIEMSPEVRALYVKAAESNQIFQGQFESLFSQIEKSNFTPEERMKFMNEITSGQASQSKVQVIKDVDTLVVKIKSLIEERSKDSIAAAEETKIINFLGLTSALLLSIVLLVIFFRNIFSNLGQIQKTLSDASTQVEMASEHLSSASQQLSESASESAASLEESVASMQELSSMVQLNAKNSQQASELTLVSRREADRGGEDMGVLAQRMNQIQQSSSQMEQIIGVIDDIAFQTNLLALNAAVEAARAGDQGKGFAVVADAVRALAQKSASSAKEISDLIKQSSEQVSSGVQMTEKSQKAFREVVTSIGKVSELNNEIAKASQEQASGVSQATSGMNQLDVGVQSNAATAEEIAASSEELSAQVKSLRTTVEQLNSLIDGGIKAPDERVSEAPPKRSRVSLKSAA